MPDRTMNRIVPALVLALLLLPAVQAAEEDPSLASLRMAAERGEVEAQYELAVLYEFGFHLPDHRTSALAWYARAAEQGNAAAAQRRDLLKAELSAAEIEQAGRLLAPPAPTASR
jgi:TPR repeat protein